MAEEDTVQRITQDLSRSERIAYRMIHEAAEQGRPCPTNLDIEMEIGCASTSSAPNAVRRLEDRGLIEVIRFQRFRDVRIFATGKTTAPHPDRHTTRKHVPRGMKGQVSMCSQCHEPDAQEHCTQDQCYWKEMQRQEEERNAQLEEEYQREMNSLAEEHFDKHPHG